MINNRGHNRSDSGLGSNMIDRSGVPPCRVRASGELMHREPYASKCLIPLALRAGDLYLEFFRPLGRFFDI